MTEYQRAIEFISLHGTTCTRDDLEDREDVGLVAHIFGKHACHVAEDIWNHGTEYRAKRAKRLPR